MTGFAVTPDGGFIVGAEGPNAAGGAEFQSIQWNPRSGWSRWNAFGAGNQPKGPFVIPGQNRGQVLIRSRGGHYWVPAVSQ